MTGLVIAGFLATVHFRPHSLHENLKEDDLPFSNILRFTGIQGFERDYLLVRQELADIPNTAFTKPTILENGTLMMVDGGETLALFEATYHPMKIYLAKRSLMRLLLNSGQDKVYKFSQIPATAHDELMESIRRNHPSCWVPRELRVSLSLSLRCEVKMKTRSIFVSVPLPTPALGNPSQYSQNMEAEMTSQLDAENTMLNATKDIELRGFAEVKLYVEKPEGYATFYPAQRRLLDKFETWRLNEDSELDKTISKALSQDKSWYKCLEIFQSKTFAEMQKASPETATTLSSLVLKESAREGYGNNTEAMKADFMKAPLSHSFSFRVSFCLPDGKIGTVNYPAG